MKSHEKQWKTIKNHEKPTWHHEKPWKTNLKHHEKPWKTMKNHEKPTDLHDTAWESDDFSSHTRGHNWPSWHSMRKWWFFVTNAGSQLTFMTQHEKVMIFRYQRGVTTDLLDAWFWKMSYFECHLNRRFWRSKKWAQVVQIFGGGGGRVDLDKIQKNGYFFFGKASLSQSVSCWQCHLLSCPGQLKRPAQKTFGIEMFGSKSLVKYVDRAIVDDDIVAWGDLISILWSPPWDQSARRKQITLKGKRGDLFGKFGIV